MVTCTTHDRRTTAPAIIQNPTDTEDTKVVLPSELYRSTFDVRVVPAVEVQRAGLRIKCTLVPGKSPNTVLGRYEESCPRDQCLSTDSLNASSLCEGNYVCTCLIFCPFRSLRSPEIIGHECFRLHVSQGDKSWRGVRSPSISCPSCSFWISASSIVRSHSGSGSSSARTYRACCSTPRQLSLSGKNARP